MSIYLATEQTLTRFIISTIYIYIFSLALCSRRFAGCCFLCSTSLVSPARPLTPQRGRLVLVHTEHRRSQKAHLNRRPRRAFVPGTHHRSSCPHGNHNVAGGQTATGADLQTSRSPESEGSVDPQPLRSLTSDLLLSWLETACPMGRVRWVASSRRQAESLQNGVGC